MNRVWINVGLWTGGFVAGAIVFGLFNNSELSDQLFIVYILAIIGGMLSIWLE